MAQTTRVHGDYQPVMNYDAPNYTVGAVNAVTSAVTVQPQGPKLDFFTVTFTGELTTAQLNTAVQTIQQLATIYLYEYTDATDDTLAVAVYPTGAWDTTSLDTALTAAVEACTVVASATFTN
jgi:hypothetical protein